MSERQDIHLDAATASNMLMQAAPVIEQLPDYTFSAVSAACGVIPSLRLQIAPFANDPISLYPAVVSSTEKHGLGLRGDGAIKRYTVGVFTFDKQLALPVGNPENKPLDPETLQAYTEIAQTIGQLSLATSQAWIHFKRPPRHDGQPAPLRASIFGSALYPGQADQLHASLQDTIHVHRKHNRGAAPLTRNASNIAYLGTTLTGNHAIEIVATQPNA